MPPVPTSTHAHLTLGLCLQGGLHFHGSKVRWQPEGLGGLDPARAKEAPVSSPGPALIGL